MSDWKPGDVAIGTSKYTRSSLLVRRHDGDWIDLNGEVLEGWVATRPLVVIDPEDAEQVERLLRTYHLRYPAMEPWDVRPDQTAHLQAALREFARPTPPKPEEPTGLGAVVEAENGKRWVKVDTAMGCDSWTEADCGFAGSDTWVKYDYFKTVRVLSEGVPS